MPKIGHYRLALILMDVATQNEMDVELLLLGVGFMPLLFG